MAFETISGALQNLSLKDIVVGDTSLVLSLFYFIIMISTYSIIIWHFYRFLARRDCFTYHNTRYPRIINLLKYMLCFPLVAFLFFIGLSFMLLFITKDYNLSMLLSTAFVLVTSVRIVSYYSEDLSRDLSKMLPFALLALVIIDPSYFSINDVFVKIATIPLFFTLCIKYILYIVIMEWILRAVLHIKCSLKSHTTALMKDTQSTNMSWTKI